ncbi:uncharacterized protein V1516DRAFT_680458 [Lipomyces oligophaga]|uniref:uncharacterized protein n=1 Tax=Lipomyces oligophaga TaxID=45792 RepID=UPI0034CF1F5D
MDRDLGESLLETSDHGSPLEHPDSDVPLDPHMLYTAAAHAENRLLSDSTTRAAVEAAAVAAVNALANSLDGSTELAPTEDHVSDVTQNTGPDDVDEHDFIVESREDGKLTGENELSALHDADQSAFSSTWPGFQMMSSDIGDMAPLIQSKSFTSTEQVIVFHCPVPGCLSKTYAKRGRRAIMRHLSQRKDPEHVAAFALYGRTRTTMTKRERSRKTSATYREKHQDIATRLADEQGTPYLAPLYNSVLVKKHEAYLRKKIRAALDAVEEPSWPTSVLDQIEKMKANSHSSSTAPVGAIKPEEPNEMRVNIFWLLQELDGSFPYRHGADIVSSLLASEQIYRHRLHELQNRYPERNQDIASALTQLEHPELLQYSGDRYKEWKKAQDLQRARQKLDLERYKNECEEVMEKFKEWREERTPEGFERKVKQEMEKWRTKVAEKLRDQWVTKAANANPHSASLDSIHASAEEIPAGHQDPKSDDEMDPDQVVAVAVQALNNAS